VSNPEGTAIRLQAEASTLLDELTSWAERLGDPAEDPEGLATDGLRILDGSAQRIRERLGNGAKGPQAGSDRGPAPHDGLDMGKALAARRKGLPTKTVFDHVVEDPRPKPPAGFWPADLSAHTVAKKKAREGR